MSKQKSSFGKIIVLIIIVLIAAAIALNWTWVRDFYRGTIYRPSDTMMQIRDSLDLTERGNFLFNASQPALNSEEEFNDNCQSFDDEEAVLGCYTDFNIYVYNITEPRLKGIRELTTAHELLHAVYARMDVIEKDALRADLEKVYLENTAVLKEEIEAYDTDEQLEEIYVRSGTEIKNLPETLEKHFAEVFNDQDKIVDFYNSYIKVFRELEGELDNLKSAMDNLDTQIESKTNEYEKWVKELEAKIDDFNNCANTAGCFNSEIDFTNLRNQLLREQNLLEDLYGEIDGLIDQYNAYVDKYNNNVIESENLQNIINSHVKMEGI